MRGGAEADLLVAGVAGRAARPVILSYVITNATAANGAVSFSASGSISAFNDITVTVISVAQGGAVAETMESIKLSAPFSYAAQNRTVTAKDYAAIVPTIYPNVESVTAYGGEEMTPPRFGKVFISVKPRNGDFLSDETKRELIQKLKSYAVAGIVPEFIDLKYLYVELQVNPYYNPSLNDTPELLKTNISNALTQYSRSIDVNKFGGRFKYSKVTTLIDRVDNGITSNNKISSALSEPDVDFERIAA